MATYEELYGKRVKEFDSDPTLDSSYEGQVWYDKSTGVLKSVVSFDTWFSGTPLSEARRLGGGFGTNSASITFGGFPGNKTTTEEYNGSGWVSGGALNNGTARFAGSTGTLTAGLTAGGLSSPTVYQNSTEEYNGTSWTTGNNLPAARGCGSRGGIGTQTAAIIAVGGDGIPTNADAATLKYDGTNWTAGGSMNTGRLYTAGFGTQTAGLYAGGYTTAAVANVELYDGTSWSETTDISTARYSFASSTNSPQTSGVIAGGDAAPGQTNATESWNGSSWTTRATMGTAISTGTGAGSSSGSMMSSGGYISPSAKTNVEEFTQSINTITAAAFASGGVYPAQYYGLGSSTNGTQNAALGFAGNYPGGFTGNTTTNEYDGSSWTAKPAMSTARAYLAGFGTSTAAVAVGGLVPPGATGSNAVEEFTGSWTAGNTIPQAGWNQGACGTLTAGLVAFGTNPAYPGQYALTFEYDGTNWTAANAGPTATNDSKGMGVQTSALFAGGGPPSAEAKASYEYDGTNWTAGGTLANEHKAGVTLGSSKDAGIVGGGHTSPQTAVEGYDGTAWSSRPSMATSRGRGGMSGTDSAGVVFGGNPSATNATEEWTNETETITSKTLTSS
jgi:hypothetical protein